MTLEQLRIFVSVADRLNMTSAAADLHLTQSAVSAAVAALEATHATRLFDRVGRGLVLSEAGRAFLPDARGVLAQAAAATQVLDDLSGLRRGHLRIAASQTIASYWLPPRLATFAQSYPAVELSVAVSNSARVANAVLDGTADLGFVEGNVQAPALLHQHVGFDRVSLYARSGHPLSRGPLSATKLQQIAWALREAGSGTRAVLDDALRGAGFTPNQAKPVIELPSNEALLAAVATSDLVTAVSDLAAAPHVATGQVTRLRYDLPERAFELLSHKERHRSRAAAAFTARL